jgi:hypothetical protein
MLVFVFCSTFCSSAIAEGSYDNVAAVVVRITSVIQLFFGVCVLRILVHLLLFYYSIRSRSDLTLTCRLCFPDHRRNVEAV